MTFQVFWCRHCNAPEEIHVDNLRECNVEFREWWLEDDGLEEGYAHTLLTCPGYEPKDGAAHAGQLLASLARLSSAAKRNGPPTPRFRGSSFDAISRLIACSKIEQAIRSPE